MNLTYNKIQSLLFGTDASIIGDAMQSGDEWFIQTPPVPTYPWYRAVARAIAPKRILETGVRYGYSAIAMLDGARMAGVQFPEYTGIDGELDGLETNDIAGTNIRKSGPMTGSIVKCDTRNFQETEHALRSLQKDYSGPVWYFDLIHLDGDHRPDGVKAELELAERWIAPNGVILVDDCDVQHVRDAACDLAYRISSHIIDLPTIHQVMLIEVNKTDAGF